MAQSVRVETPRGISGALTVVLLLAVRLPRWGWRVDTFWIALIGSAAALYYAAPWDHLAPFTAEQAIEAAKDPSLVTQRMEIFSGTTLTNPANNAVLSIQLQMRRDSNEQGVGDSYQVRSRITRRNIL